MYKTYFKLELMYNTEKWTNRKMKEKHKIRSIRGKMKTERIMNYTIREESAIHGWMEVKNENITVILDTLKK